MAQYSYISVHKFCEFHDLERRWVEEFIESGLFVPEQHQGQDCIPEEDLPRLETMLRLRIQLDINPAGIEAIMHMRETIQELRHRLQELERLTRE